MLYMAMMIVATGCLVTPESYRKKGDTFYQNEEYEKALENYEKAYKDLKSDSEFELQLARTYWKTNKIPECQKTLLGILEYRPDFVEAYRLLVQVYTLMKNFQKVVETYETIVELDPSDVVAQNNLGILYSKLKKPNEAIACFQTCMRLQPDYAEAYINLANVYAQNLRDDDTAYYFYKKFTELKPNSSRTAAVRNWLSDYDLTHTGENKRAISLEHFFKGEALLVKAEFEAALEMYQKALTQFNHPDYYYKVGYVQKELGDYDKAIVSLNKAIEMEPRNQEYRYYLGWVYKLAGQTEEAKSQWEIVLRNDPEHRRARKALALL